MNKHQRKNTELIQEFNRYVREHPSFAERIPNDAAVVIMLPFIPASKNSNWKRSRR